MSLLSVGGSSGPSTSLRGAVRDSSSRDAERWNSAMEEVSGSPLFSTDEDLDLDVEYGSSGSSEDSGAAVFSVDPFSDVIDSSESCGFSTDVDFNSWSSGVLEVSNSDAAECCRSAVFSADEELSSRLSEVLENPLPNDGGSTGPFTPSSDKATDVGPLEDLPSLPED